MPLDKSKDLSPFVSEYNRNRRLDAQFFFEIIVSKDFRRHTKSSISGFRAAHDSNQNFESGVNAKLFGKPETTAFRRYAQLGYFGVGNDLRFLLYSLTIFNLLGKRAKVVPTLERRYQVELLIFHEGPP